MISYTVWAYHRFCLTFRDVEDLVAERGIIVSYEMIRQWCQKFGPVHAQKLKRREDGLGGAKGNGECTDSSLLGTRDGFSRFMMLSRISSQGTAIY